MTLNPMLVWALVAMLSACSVLSSTLKIFAWPKRLLGGRQEFMRAHGLSRQVIVLVGTAELFGAVAIWFQPGIVGLVGAIVIGATSLSMIGLHVFYDSWRSGILSTVTLVSSGLLILNSWPLLESMPASRT